MFRKSFWARPALYLLPVFLLAALLAGCPGPTDPEPEPPEPPVNINVVPGDSSLTVTWQEAVNAATYELYFADENTPPGAEASANITTITGTTHKITDLDNDTTYYVWVRAKNSVGVSNYSGPVSGKPRAADINDLTATLPAGTYKSAALPSEAGGYGNDWYTIEIQDGNIAYYYAGNQSFAGRGISYKNNVVIIEVTATSEYGPTAGKYYGVYMGNLTSFSFTGSNAYKTDSNYNSGMDTLEAAIAEYTDANGYFGIKADYGLYAGEATVTEVESRLEVTWAAVTGAIGYELYYSDTEQPTSTTTGITANVTINDTTATITGLNNGTSYNVWVRAKDASHTGAWVYQGSGTPKDFSITTGDDLTLPAGTYKSAALPSEAGGYGDDWYTIEIQDGNIAYYYAGNQSFAGRGISYNNNVVIIEVSETSEYGPTIGKYYGVYMGNLTSFSFTGANAYKTDSNYNSGLDTLEAAIAEYTDANDYFGYKADYGFYAGTATITRTDSGLEVSWSSVPGATGYDVYYSDTEQPTSTTNGITANVTIANTTATITGLAEITPYNVWVRAKTGSTAGAWVYQGSGTPAFSAFAGYFKGDVVPYDDGIGITATHFYQYDDGALGISYAGEIVKHIPVGDDGKAGTIIIRITDGGTWGKTTGSYYAIDYKNYGYAASMEVVRVQASSAYKLDGENNGLPTLAEAVAKYTIANGYFGTYGNYRQFREEIPQVDGALTLTGLTGGWSGADDGGDGDDYFIRIANPVLSWSSDLGYNTSTHQFAGTIVETTDATAASGYIYFKVDFVNTKSGDYDNLEVGSYYAIHWKDKADGGIKLCAAYGTDTDGAETLAEAKTTYTVANNYFDDDYYVVIAP
jgi:hypothetical protein